MKTIPRNLQKIPALVIIATTLFTAFFIAWASNRGLDITDEGFYLLASQHPHQMQIWPDVFYIYTGILYHLVSYDITLFRIVGLLLLLISAYIFFRGWYRLLNALNLKIHLDSHKNTMLALILLGALLYYTSFLLTPSYDLLNSFATTSSFGFLCFSLASIEQHLITPKKPLIYLFLSGLLIGFCLLVKFPTAILLIATFTISLSLWPNIIRKQRLLYICTLWFGATLWICLHVFFLQSLPTLYKTIMGGIQHTHSNDTGHAISACLYNYTNDLITLVSTVLQFSWKIYAIILISFSAAIFFHSKSDKKNSWLNLILFLLFIRMAEKCYRDKLLFSGGYLFVHVLMQFYLAWFFLLIFTLILSAYYNKELIQPIIKNNKFHFSILAILLLSLPFISAIGTNNPIMQNTIMCMVSWFALLEVLFALLAYLQNNQGIYWVGTLIIAFFAGSQIISASLSPYRLNTDIFKQNISTTIGVPATNVQLDLATSNFFKAVQKIAISHGFKPGDDILAFTDMPGIVFALGGKSPVIAGFTSTPNAVNVDTQLMELIAPTRLKQAFILENGRLGFPQLSKFNIKFPQDYKLCGEVMWPLTKEWVRLWQPKYRQENNLQ